MLRIDQLHIAPGQGEAALRSKAAKLLRVAPEQITSLQLLRRAIDAREELRIVCSVAVSVKNESAVLRRCRDRRVTPYAPKVY